MLFFGSIKYTYDDKEDKEDIIITAESFKDAVEKIENYYGEDLIKQSLECIGPEDFFTGENLKDIKKRIEDNIIW